MIVLKATQEKLLSVLQSVAGIVEKRHTLPILANVLVRKTAGNLQFWQDGVHLEGSNYLFADGHVKWLRGSKVSYGTSNTSANAADCGTGISSSTISAKVGCDTYAATFGIY